MAVQTKGRYGGRRYQIDSGLGDLVWTEGLGLRANCNHPSQGGVGADRRN